jgi:hypothetical protein
MAITHHAFDIGTGKWDKLCYGKEEKIKNTKKREEKNLISIAIKTDKC